MRLGWNITRKLATDNGSGRSIRTCGRRPWSRIAAMTAKCHWKKEHSTKDGQRPYERPGIESGDPRGKQKREIAPRRPKAVRLGWNITSWLATDHGSGSSSRTCGRRPWSRIATMTAKCYWKKEHSTKDGQRPYERPGVESGDPE